MPGLNCGTELNDSLLQYSCLENSVGRGALVGYSLWACKEWDMPEHISQPTEAGARMIGGDLRSSGK